MGLETAVYINDLNPANPSALDPVPEGDDHIRMIKQVLQNTFPGLAGPFETFPSGTKLLFAQAAAPTGWTQDVTDAIDNRMLRVVKTAGGGTGGSHSPILMDVIPTHSHTGTATATDTNHTHSGATSVDGWHAHTYGQSFNYDNGTTGGSSPNLGGNLGTAGAGSHQHSFTTGGMSANASHSHTVTVANNVGGSNWTPKYMDLILCTKD